MTDVLTDHAIKHVWCTPNQDLQVIYEPQRITRPRGARGEVSYNWHVYPMPTPNEVYHVFVIGQYPPEFVGLDTTRNLWRTVGSIMESERLYADVYTSTGRQLVRREVYVLVTQNRNLLVAVRAQDRVVNAREEKIFLRLYSNAFYYSNQGRLGDYEIVCRSKEVRSAQEALEFQRHYHIYRDRPVGAAMLFVNGYYRDDYRPNDYVVGDKLEFVYDSSVKMVKEFRLRYTPTFESNKDDKRKYLLSWDGAQIPEEMIDYRDDIDVYLVRKTGGRHKGLYYHKNNDDALRQVTHRDYSVVVDYVAGYQATMLDDGWDTLDDVWVRLFIRHSGYQRPLADENNRIRELYKLPYRDRVKAMVGVDATVENWRAETLENSPYINLMDLRRRYITNELVREAYGYNAISAIIGNTPQQVKVQGQWRYVELPYGLQNLSTAFEIDASGKLISSYLHTSGYFYTAFNSNCEMVEMIGGRGGRQLDMRFAEQNVPIDRTRSYRFYVAEINQGLVLNDTWQDVTGDDTKYAIVDGKVVWFVNLSLFAVCVASDAYFLNYEEYLSSTQGGLYRFSVNATTKWAGEDRTGVAVIPPGRLDVWLNDECLIEGLDYFVKWPEVVISNKRYLNTTGRQKVRVRCTGFCDSDMQRPKPADYGFVRYGRLSRNNRFDIRDDRVMRFVVNGRTYDRSVLEFIEDDASVYMQNVPNGAPYVIDDIVVPLRRVTDVDTYDLRNEAREIDKKVSDYLTMKLPEPVEPNPDQILERYEIFSPFAATVMHDLVNGVLSTDQFLGHYSDMDVRRALEDNYSWLLDYDPTTHDLDLEHVHVHPHERYTEVELDIWQYNLLNRAIKVFLDDKVDITRFVRIRGA